MTFGGRDRVISLVVAIGILGVLVVLATGDTVDDLGHDPEVEVPGADLVEDESGSCAAAR